MELHTEIEIQATAEAVWAELLRFEAYPEWNPFIRSLEGLPVKGERLRVRIEPPGSKGMTFRPTVIAAEAGVELRWLGRLLMPGLFDGEHSFAVRRMDSERTQFVQREVFRGLLVPLFARRLRGATRQGFERMNEALKRRAEGSAREAA